LKTFPKNDQNLSLAIFITINMFLTQNRKHFMTCIRWNNILNWFILKVIIKRRLTSRVHTDILCNHILSLKKSFHFLLEDTTRLQ